MMKIKVYIGVIGSGKDYAANNECDVRMAFADPLREDVWNLIGWEPKTEAKYEQFKSASFVSLYSWTTSGNQPTFTGRELLQRHGSRMKELFGERYWADRFKDDFGKKYSELEGKTIGISDCRFPSEIVSLLELSDYCEVEFVHRNYKSEKYDPSNTHISEKLAQKYLDFTGTQEEFNALIYKEYDTAGKI